MVTTNTVERSRNQRGSVVELGPLQRQALDFVWEHARCTVRECRDALSEGGHDLAYTTVQTVFDVLHRKRLVSRRRAGNAYHYTARETRVSLLARLVRELLSRFGGEPQPVASSLVDALEEGDGARLKALVEELKQRGHM
jgi:predicted transcriptional regulator